jgi:LuxR family transcriptional regulator, positive regulator of biofilm formation
VINLQHDGHPQKPRKSLVVILGPHKQYYEALAYVLEREICERCLICADSHALPPELRRSGHRKVLLIDFMDANYEKTLVELAVSEDWASAGVVLALFNMKPGPGTEQKAFRRGVRGFFYKDDPLDLLLRGLVALLSGEVWMSRELLTSIALGGKSVDGVTMAGAEEPLTERELQVLALLSVGANNAEIAEKLYISKHTVKTHIYNVFKKIGVPNRLQAALWAEKNL